jgi:hypothetical protein
MNNVAIPCSNSFESGRSVYPNRGTDSKSGPRQIIPKKGDKWEIPFLEASPGDWTSFLRCKKNCNSIVPIQRFFNANAFKTAVMKNLGLDPDSAKTGSGHDFQQNDCIRFRRIWIRNTENKGNIINVGSVPNHPAAIDSVPVNLDPKCGKQGYIFYLIPVRCANPSRCVRFSESGSKTLSTRLHLLPGTCAQPTCCVDSGNPDPKRGKQGCIYYLWPVHSQPAA